MKICCFDLTFDHIIWNHHLLLATSISNLLTIKQKCLSTLSEQNLYTHRTTLSEQKLYTHRNLAFTFDQINWKTIWTFTFLGQPLYKIQYISIKTFLRYWTDNIWNKDQQFPFNTNLIKINFIFHLILCLFLALVRGYNATPLKTGSGDLMTFNRLTNQKIARERFYTMEMWMPLRVLYRL